MNLSIQTDLVYADQSRPLRWNVYKPATGAGDAPVVLVIHGGGWRAGDRAMMADACTAYARRGFVAIAPEYRLLGEAAWPAALEDIKLAVQAVRTQSGELGTSSNHIFLNGFSAGAHLSLLTASALPGLVAGVAAFFPPARISPELGTMLGINGASALVEVSPIEHAAKLPPTILFCGDADDMTPPDLSLELYRAIRKSGRAADIHLFSDMIHEFVMLPGMLDETLDDAVRFFARTVINKKSFDAASDSHRKWWASMIGAPAAQS